MCGRFSLKNKKAVKDIYDIDIIPRYNIAPSQKILMFSGIKLYYIRWSFSPTWAKIPMNLSNAREESLSIKPSFKNCKRCVIIADGWYEWKKSLEHKTPFYHYIDNSLIHIAGIYNNEGCAIVTTNSSKKILHIHHRQPLLLDKLDISNWIKGEKLLNTCLSDKVQYYPVSQYVNYPSNNGTKCIERI
ncbi:MAG TPA: SOS response-associated peptidase [Alphaproteobacteria bacterium]|jgi:putative SOS response-associated peptidase YedK|nr:SOS response-associated peptidase [Alphaproteobacteria bacterium]